MVVSELNAVREQLARYVWHHGMQDDTYFTNRHKVIASGDGIYVRDAEGKRYIDGTSGQAVVQVGHGRAEIAQAIAEQATTLAFSPVAFGYSHVRVAELGERLAKLSPGSLSKTYFSCSGSEAVETAIKLARQAQTRLGRPRKRKIIARRGSYHGVTYGALSATAAARLRNPCEPLVGGFLHIAQPYPRTCGFCAGGPCNLGCADDLARAIEFEGPDTVAAFIAEPVATPETIKIPTRDYWSRISEICDGYDVLLVADEVLVGFGRSGRLFASEHFDLAPDILTMSKGLTSGYVPLSGAIATEAIADLFDSPTTAFQHAGTYSGHPVACAAALANLDILEREGLPENAARQGERLRKSLAPLSALPFVHSINILGLLVGIDLQATPEASIPDLGCFIRDQAFDGGLICRFAPTSINLYPPLTISDEQTDEVAAILIATFTDAADRFRDAS